MASIRARNRSFERRAVLFQAVSDERRRRFLPRASAANTCPVFGAWERGGGPRDADRVTPLRPDRPARSLRPLGRPAATLRVAAASPRDSTGSPPVPGHTDVIAFSNRPRHGLFTTTPGTTATTGATSAIPATWPPVPGPPIRAASASTAMTRRRRPTRPSTLRPAAIGPHRGPYGKPALRRVRCADQWPCGGPGGRNYDQDPVPGSHSPRRWHQVSRPLRLPRSWVTAVKLSAAAQAPGVEGFSLGARQG